MDGHIVRSKGELIIDNTLHHLGIDNEYENIVRGCGHPIKYDWYLPRQKVYIEYWGYHGKNYMKRKYTIISHWLNNSKLKQCNNYRNYLKSKFWHCMKINKE